MLEEGGCFTVRVTGNGPVYDGSVGSGFRLVTPSRLKALITVIAQATATYCSSVKTPIGDDRDTCETGHGLMLMRPTGA
jgi:hypothetical protein